MYREVSGLAGSWSDMCLVLGLLPSDQSAIEVAHPRNPHNCLRAVVVKWLQKGYNYQRFGSPTWRMLVNAVSDPAGGNNCALAETIAKKHPGVCIVYAKHVLLQFAIRCGYHQGGKVHLVQTSAYHYICKVGFLY